MRALSPRSRLRSVFVLLALSAGLGAVMPALAQEPTPGTEATAVPTEAAEAPRSEATSAAVQQPTPQQGLKERLAKRREDAPPTTVTDRLISLAGLFVMLGIAWALSVKRSAIDFRVVIGGTF